MIDIGKKMYHKIPISLRWFFWAVRLPFDFIDISKLDLLILNGEEINSHQELSIASARYLRCMKVGNIRRER